MLRATRARAIFKHRRYIFGSKLLAPIERIKPVMNRSMAFYLQESHKWSSRTWPSSFSASVFVSQYKNSHITNYASRLTYLSAFEGLERRTNGFGASDSLSCLFTRRMQYDKQNFILLRSWWIGCSVQNFAKSFIRASYVDNSNSRNITKHITSEKHYFDNTCRKRFTCTCYTLALHYITKWNWTLNGFVLYSIVIDSFLINSL